MYYRLSRLVTSRFFDFSGGLAAIFMLFDLCLVWYGAIYNGILNPIFGVGVGWLPLGELVIVLSVELFVVAPLAVLWIFAKFRGFI